MIIRYLLDYADGQWFVWRFFGDRGDDKVLVETFEDMESALQFIEVN
jgi:hypothetical protein